MRSSMIGRELRPTPGNPLLFAGELSAPLAVFVSSLQFLALDVRQLDGRVLTTVSMNNAKTQSGGDAPASKFQIMTKHLRMLG